MSKKVKITALCLIAMLCLSLSGCKEEDSVGTAGNNQTSKTRFVDIGDTYQIAGEKYHVVVDTKTNLIYLQAHYNGGFNEFIGDDNKQYTLEEYNATK